MKWTLEINDFDNADKSLAVIVEELAVKMERRGEDGAWRGEGWTAALERTDAPEVAAGGAELERVRSLVLQYERQAKGSEIAGDAPVAAAFRAVARDINEALALAPSVAEAERQVPVAARLTADTEMGLRWKGEISGLMGLLGEMPPETPVKAGLLYGLAAAILDWADRQIAVRGGPQEGRTR